MEETQKFTTISEAVETALNEWSEQGNSLDDLETLVIDFVQKALMEWEETPEDELPVPVPASEAGLIVGAVLNAMADWHSDGTDFEEMASMAEEFALSAFEEWKSSRGLDEETP